MYLNVEISKKVYTKFGDGFESLSRKKVCIIKSIYRLVSLGYYFQLYLRATLCEIGFTRSFYNENLWVLKKDNRTLTCISIYVDDVLISLKVLFKY